ncbi:hypothetical protein [Pedococcus sp. P5_B7]
MTSTLDPVLLGPLMILFTVLWFGAMSWAGMHEDDASWRATRPRSLDEPGPWWTNRGFDGLPQATTIPVEPGNPRR